MKVSKESVIPPGFEPEISESLDRRSTDWAIAIPSRCYYNFGEMC